jgi:hypothetical protein
LIYNWLKKQKVKIYNNIVNLVQDAQAYSSELLKELRVFRVLKLSKQAD